MVTPIDESIQSFILRQTLLRKGSFVPNDVFSKCGGWFYEPRISRDMVEAFEHFSDQKLIQLAEESISERKKVYGLFAPPSEGQDIVEQAFSDRAGNNRWRRIIRVKYCPKCIVDMIREVGFGYFRKSWNDSNRCLKHKISLEILDSANARTSAMLVAKLLAGLTVPSIKALPDSSTKKKSNEVWGKKRLTVYPIKAGVCTIKPFSKVLRAIDFESLKNGWKNGSILAKVDYNDPNFGPFSGHWWYSSPIMGFGIDTHMTWLQHHPRVSKFFNEEVDYFVFTFGAKKQLTEVFFAPKKRDCSYCKDSECRQRVMLSEKIDRPEFKDLLKISSMLKRFMENRFILYRTGSHVWGPLVVEIGKGDETLVAGEFGGLV